MARGGKRRSRKNRKRSEAAKRGWNNRTRREGIRQITGALATYASEELSKVKTAAEVIDGIIKVVAPEKYRKARKELRNLLKK